MKQKKSLQISLLVICILACFTVLIAQASNSDNDVFRVYRGENFTHLTCVWGDYFIVFNGSTLLKYDLWHKILETSLAYNDTIFVNHVERKGQELLVDYTESGQDYFMCIDLDTMTQRGEKVNQAKFTPNFYTLRLGNVAYLEIEGDDCWAWYHMFSPAYPNGDGNFWIAKYPWFYISGEYRWGFWASGNCYTGNSYSGNLGKRIYVYNATSDAVTYFSANDVGIMVDHTNFHGYMKGVWDGSGSWVEITSDWWRHHTGGGSCENKGVCLQCEISEIPVDNNESGRAYYDFSRWGVRYQTTHEENWFWSGGGDREYMLPTTNYVWRIRWMDANDVHTAEHIESGFTIGATSETDGRKMNTPDWGLAGHGFYITDTGSSVGYIAYRNETDFDAMVEGNFATVFQSEGGFRPWANPADSRFYRGTQNLVGCWDQNDTGDTWLYVDRNMIYTYNLQNPYFSPSMEFISANVTAVSGGLNLLDHDGYMFKGEVYEFTTRLANVTWARFDMSDGFNNMSFVYQNASDRMFILSDNQMTIGLIGSSYDNIYNATYDLMWRFVLDENVVDCQNVTIMYDLFNFYEGHDTGYAAYGVKIYNLGGYANYTFSGDSGRVSGGDSFEVWAENSTGGSTAQANVMWRRLQHVNVIWGLDVEDNSCFDHHEQTGTVSFGLQIMENSVWIDQIYGIMTIVDGAVDPVSGVGKAWITCYVNWFSRDVYGNMTSAKTSYMSAFPECFDDVNHPMTQVRFHSDVWFNKMNSSTTLGIRLSPMFYGMEETGGVLLWGAWNPALFNESATMCFVDLRDSTGSLMQPHEIELMRFWMEVEKTGSGDPLGGDCDDHLWAISSPKLSYNRAADRMQAIDTPTGVEPLVPDMPNTSFMSGITKAIQGISSMIWAGALSFIKILWSSMDTIFQWIGFPAGTMTKIVDFVLMIPEYMIDLIGHFGDLLVNMASQVTLFFALVTVGIPQMIWGVGLLVNTLISYIREFTSLFTGGWSGVANLWGNLNIGAFVELFVVAILPLMWLERVFSARDSFKTAREDVSFFFKMIFSIIDLGSWLIRTIATIIGAIRDILPI